MSLPIQVAEQITARGWKHGIDVNAIRDRLLTDCFVQRPDEFKPLVADVFRLRPKQPWTNVVATHATNCSLSRFRKLHQKPAIPNEHSRVAQPPGVSGCLAAQPPTACKHRAAG